MNEFDQIQTELIWSSSASVISLIWAYLGVVEYDLFDSPSAFFLHSGIAFHKRYFSGFWMLHISWCILFSNVLVRCISWCILFSNMLVRWMPHVSTRIFGILLKIEPTHQIKTMFLHQLGKLFFQCPHSYEISDQPTSMEPVHAQAATSH